MGEEVGKDREDTENTRNIEKSDRRDTEARASSSEAADSVWEDAEDLTSLGVDELKALLVRFDDEEKSISYRRRILQGRIDVIRAEIVRRGEASLSPEDLVRVLMGNDITEKTEKEEKDTDDGENGEKA